MLNSSSLRIASLAVLTCGLLPSAAQAGPLIDWLFGRSRIPPAYAVGAPAPVGVANPYATGYGAYSPYGSNPYAAGYAAYPQASAVMQNPGIQNPALQGMAGQTAMPGYAANYGAYYGPSMPVIGPAGAGYQTQMPSGITATTMPGMAPTTIPQTLSYVPNFNTYSNRAAVTYYRPLLTTDPNTGAQVVAMAPCTSYEYQAQRVPAFGRSALYGSTVPPVMQPAPAGLPTYTLPSGGIPLASSGPSVMQPTLRGYGVYPTPQSGMTYVAPGTYPTNPLGNSAYYGSNAGGSCGALQGVTPVPGLVAPQAPIGGYPPPGYATPNYTTPAPGYPAPGFTAPAPGYQPPNEYSPGVYPPSNPPSSDPAADAQPTLPPTFPTNINNQTFLRPQQQEIARQPLQSNSQQVGGSSANAATKPTEGPSLMNPIPVPEGFDERPRWNPGLLQEDDMTAGRAIDNQRLAVAGQSKTIRWASFDGESRASAKVEARDAHDSLTLTPSYATEYDDSTRPDTVRDQRVNAPSANNATAPQLRPKQLSPVEQPNAGRNRRQYDNSGWEVAR